MSVLFNALDKLDEKEGVSSMPWSKAMAGSRGQIAVDLPQEMLNEFYDLREYIRIANMRGLMRVLSITSSVSGEGSSTVATYLALLMAGVNKRANESMDKSSTPVSAEAGAEGKMFEEEFQAFVQDSDDEKKEKKASDAALKQGGILLIDANLHKPGLHEIMGLSLEDGLADVLEKQTDWHPYLKTVKDVNLSVITAGKSKQNPSELLGTDFFRHFIKAVKEEYSYVLVDSPAVLNYVDSLSIAAIADGVILVVQAGQTRWEMAQNAKRKLLTAHANLLGVALNRRKMQP
jgi:capsular exopolysaccharide synthesis family protein